MLIRNVAALCLGGVLLSACSSSSEPAPATLPTLSATPTPTVTLAPIPSAATASTPQGADAFVRYFFDQMNVAFRTSNASIIDALSTPACITCNNYEKALEAAKRKGTLIDGDSFQVSAVAAPPPEAGRTMVDVIVTAPVRNQVDRAGRVLKMLPAQANFHFQVGLSTRRGSWVVSQLVGTAT